jgi:hypothetical protein
VHGPDMDVIQFPLPTRDNVESKRSLRIVSINTRAGLRGFLARIVQGDGNETVKQVHYHPDVLLIADLHMPRVGGRRLARMPPFGFFTLPGAATTATFNTGLNMDAKQSATAGTDSIFGAQSIPRDAKLQRGRSSLSLERQHGNAYPSGASC